MRTKTLNAIYNMTFKTYPFTGIWQEVFGEPETGGAWLIYGEEKQGKTWFAILLANYLSQHARVLYVSAEEGISKNFADTCKRAGLSAKSKMAVSGYEPLPELEARLNSRRPPQVVVLDNLTKYSEEMKYGKLLKLLHDYPDVLWLCLAHEEGGKPYTSTAKLCSRFAKIIVRVQGLKGFVKGRCPGGEIMIDEEKAQLVWGTNNENSKS
jgi:hypothetical protein